ncbi:MAG: 4-(cytidine 5'-diphospho)-2-C-methyl-D-erythritol kinase [Flavobacteriales bacterium CG18_big_fil_WC_8_21_14_2_50_32_9]|nr:MAG: 4-(cytidine 5'-diphospho)-2-C-methyl-D-erythritol kinase [Flavobacteriales bacterium CG18_big_fil_WC_8_21_14_2_50_32_9]
MIAFPNAKINIGLNIVEKRKDGFHTIESIFYPIFDLVDILEIIELKDKSITQFSSSGISIPGEATSNLCLKAYNLLKKEYAIPTVAIHLHKVIPIGAGLGGGSADAAFTLKLLNNLFKLNLSDDILIEYARKIGSDCAFFIKNKPVFAFGKGDEFEDINLNLSNYKIKIEYPSIHIGTAEAYSGVIPFKSKLQLKEIINQPINSWKKSIKNDFESSIFLNYPEIEQLKLRFYEEGAIYASMTGSGSAVYGIFEK